MSADEQKAPEASFQTIVYTMAMNAMIALGEIENPMTKKKQPDLRQARWHIDSLQILHEKTRGNLETAEEKAITDVLAELQVKYVEKSD